MSIFDRPCDRAQQHIEQNRITERLQTENKETISQLRRNPTYKISDEQFIIFLGGTIVLTSIISGCTGLPVWGGLLLVGGSAAVVTGIYIASKYT